jgi:hypothetical protein
MSKQSLFLPETFKKIVMKVKERETEMKIVGKKFAHYAWKLGRKIAGY